MAGSLLVVVALLLWCPVNGKEQYLHCCPEDDQHLYMYEERTCNASRTLGLPCVNESNVVALRNGRDAFWIRESDGSVVIGSTVIGTLLAPGSFCVGRMGFEGWTRNSSNTTVFQVERGIVYCEETEFYATYLGPEPLSYAICLMISAVGCFLTFVTYILVPVLHKDLLGKCLICALISFTLMYLTIGITTFEAHRMPHAYCSFQIFFMFFWTIASIYWTNVISFDIWRSVVYFSQLKLLFCFVIPMVVPPLCWGESWYASIFGAGFLRYVVLLNSAWSVNSAAHLWGGKPYDREIMPTENLLVTWLTAGEGWHNYHHAIPWDYKAAELGPSSINWTTYLIEMFSRWGWAYDLKSPSKDLVRRVVERRGDGSHPKWGGSSGELEPVGKDQNADSFQRWGSAREVPEEQ